MAVKRKSITTNGIYSLAAKVVAMLVPLIVYPYVMRILGAESYGKVTYVESLISYFLLFASLGIDTYAQRECAVFREDDKLFKKKASQVFAIGLIMSGLSLAIYLGCVFCVSSMREEWPLFVIFSLMLVAKGFSMEWLYTAQERFDITSLREVISKIIYVILCFLLVKNSGHYLIFGTIVVFSSSLFTMLWNVTGILRGECGVIPSLRESAGWITCLKPIFYLALLTLGSKLFTDSDVIMIKWFIGSESDRYVGIYNSAIILPKALDVLLMAISAVITPQLFILVRKREEEQVKNMMNLTSNALFFITTPAILTCQFFPREMLQLFAGSEYITGASVLRIYSFIIMCVLIITLAGTRTYIARQKEKKLFKILLFGAVLNIGLNILLIKRMGIDGAAWATLIAYVIIMIIELTLEKTWHYIFTIDKIKYIFGGLVVAVGFIIVKALSSHTPVTSMLIAIPVSGFAYVLAMSIMKESSIKLAYNKAKSFLTKK